METNPLRAFAEMWTRTFEPAGRTRRAAFWGALVINFIVGTVLSFFGYLGWVYSVLSVIPGISMCIRRMHDIDRTGWWLLLALIPLGGVVVLVLLLMESTGANRFGDSPKYGSVPF